MTGAFAGRRIAITRPAESAASIVQQVMRRGGNAVVRSCIAVTAIADNTHLVAELRALDADDWVLFTSRHGARAFVRATSTVWGTTRWQKRCAAIGTATAAVLAEHGLVPAIVSPEPSARALAAAVGSLEGRTVLYPTSNLANDDVANGVGSVGGLVRRVAAYRTVPGDGIGALVRDIEERSLDAIAFWSPSAIEFLAQQLTAGAIAMLPPVRIVCVGDSTAAHARANNFNVVAIAKSANETGMLDALIDSFGRATATP